VDKRTESINRARGILSGLCLSSLTTDLLLGGLIKPGLHTTGPLLVEVLIGNDYMKFSDVEEISAGIFAQM
jgi:hypothetical protein